MTEGGSQHTMGTAHMSAWSSNGVSDLIEATTHALQLASPSKFEVANDFFRPVFSDLFRSARALGSTPGACSTSAAASCPQHNTMPCIAQLIEQYQALALARRLSSSFTPCSSGFIGTIASAHALLIFGRIGIIVSALLSALHVPRNIVHIVGQNVRAAVSTTNAAAIAFTLGITKVCSTCMLKWAS